MLEEKMVVTSIDLRENNSINIQVANRILKDNVMVSETYHRYVLAPGDDVIQEDLRVQAVAAAIWTPEVVAAYRAGIIQAEEQNG